MENERRRAGVEKGAGNVILSCCQEQGKRQNIASDTDYD